MAKASAGVTLHEVLPIILRAELTLAEQPGDGPDGRQWGFLISQEATRQEELTGFVIIVF